MRPSLAAFAALSLAVLHSTGCAPTPEGSGVPTGVSRTEVPPGPLERARQAADALTVDLKAALMDRMVDEGPVSAVQVCSTVAQELVAAHAAEGLSVRRVSVKFRNPADAPDDYERRALTDLENRQGAGALPQEISEVIDEDGARRLRYMRPIVVQEICLTCHGDPDGIDPEVRRLLRERYPEDLAVGYREGDLRGAVSVIVDLPS